MNTRHLFATLLVLCLAARAMAESAPLQDPDDAIFTATDVVIVSPGEPPAFKIERVYRGKLTVGSKLDLPGFELQSWEDSDQPNPVGMNEDTRILMFLRPREGNPAALAIVDDWNYFFRGVEEMDQLDAMAKQAMAVHRKWKEARDLRNRRARVAALFPYLLPGVSRGDEPSYFGGSCRELTLEELAKLTPEAGDYLAAKLPAATPEIEHQLLLDVDRLQSPAAHDAARACADRALVRFKTYLAGRQVATLDVRAYWDELPAEVQSDYTTIYYGLSAVASFHDPQDLPYFRSLVPWLVANNLDLPMTACLGGMIANPTPENVPVLLALWEGYQPIWAAFKERNYSTTNAPQVPMTLSGAIVAHKDPVLIPALLEMLDNPTLRPGFNYDLRRLTGQEFSTPEEWKAWYATQGKGGGKAGASSHAQP